MNTSFLTTLNRYLYRARQWYEETPGRALDQAYDAALMIKAIEDEHFDGTPIATSSPKYSDNTIAYFQSELQKYLKVADLRLTEFKASRSFFYTTDSTGSVRSRGVRSAASLQNGEQGTVVLEKLRFIDQILDHYKPQSAQSLSLVPLTQPGTIATPTPMGKSTAKGPPEVTAPVANNGMVDKTGVLPRSILGTLSRIKRDLDPNSEQQIVYGFRNNKAKTVVSIRFLLLLIIIPLITQQVSKTFIVGPIVDRFRTASDAKVFLNYDLEEEALKEFRLFEERLRFDQFLGRSPAISEEKRSEQLKEKVDEIAKEYNRQSASAIKNVLTDIIALAAFAFVIVSSPRAIATLKSFIDDTIYGLSDSAKAFIIILFTDIFVGFHSPHGWEVLLQGIARHLGLPPDESFIFLFIATFPVILDTIFKYWIFRYLNRSSPSAVATYRSMNE